MVSKIFNFLNKEISGLHQAAYLLGFFAFSSQLLALVRDRLLAHYFGAGLTLDIYYTAFRIPDFIFISVASLVSVSVLIPFVIEKINISNEEASKFVSSIFSFFLILIIFSSVLGFILAPYILPVLFPGFFPESGELLVSMTRILLLSPIFLGLSNLFGSINQVFKKFFIYALSPVVYNLGIIFGILFFYPDFGINGVVYGVVIGAFLHFFIQLPFVLQTGIFPSFKLNIDFSLIKNTMLISIPRTVALSLTHIVIIFLFYLASAMTHGSISVFSFSFNLQSVPLSIIGVSYSLAAFPTLSRLFAKNEKKEFLEHIVVSAKHIIFWSIPVMVLFIVLRAQIVRTILGTGEFSWSDTRLTAAALAIFSVSVVFQGLILLFVRGYYASGRTIRPLVVNVISAMLTVVFALLFVWIFNKFELFKSFIEILLRVEGIEGSVVLMLPLAYSAGVLINGVLLWILFDVDFKKFLNPVKKTFFQSFSSSIIMGLFVYIFLNIFSLFLDINTFHGIFLQGFISGICGIIVCICILVILDNEEIREIQNTLHKRFWKAKVIGPDANIV